MDYKLTISVITMNRAVQLKEALESCLACDLPKETEFVVIDNASTDNTEQVVAEVLGNSGFDYYYEKLPENIGAGAGRNAYFAKARGEFVYGMDDDAVIDTVNNPDFFVRAIEIMEQNPSIGSLATQVFDVAWDCNRQNISGPQVAPGIYKCKMFCGGSHFLRRDIFTEPPYFANKYGSEELPPSLKIADIGKFNVFCPDLTAIHKPAVNKWNKDDEKNHTLLINEIAISYAIKIMMYPLIYRPLLWAASQIRFYRTLRKFPNARARFRKEIGEVCTNYRIEKKIKVSTVWQMMKDFGLSAF